MTPGEKAIFALFIVSSVSAELSVLVTGMPQYELRGDFGMANGKPMEKAMVLSKKDTWESYEDEYNEEDLESEAEYQRLLGIDPLTNSYITDMNSNDEGENQHMVKKRVLPYSEELPMNDDTLDLLGGNEKERL